MEMTRDTKGAAPAGAPPSGSARWSIVWIVGMLAIFLGERMMGSGSSRTVATSRAALPRRSSGC